MKSATHIDPMDLALDQARQAATRGEVPVGAVLVAPDGTILAADGNRIKELRDPTAHAEMLVLRAAAGQGGNERLMACDLYVTLEPCTMCAGAIALARIRRIYYGAADEKTGACDHGVRFFDQDSCHHRPEIYGGINETVCGDLLRDFFATRRS
ncbi:MAG: nucleoside deaminase [Parvibaculales bacterium]